MRKMTKIPFNDQDISHTHGCWSPEYQEYALNPYGDVLFLLKNECWDLFSEDDEMLYQMSYEAARICLQEGRILPGI